MLCRFAFKCSMKKIRTRQIMFISLFQSTSFLSSLLWSPLNAYDFLRELQSNNSGLRVHLQILSTQTRHLPRATTGSRCALQSTGQRLLTNLDNLDLLGKRAAPSGASLYIGGGVIGLWPITAVRIAAFLTEKSGVRARRNARQGQSHNINIEW